MKQIRYTTTFKEAVMEIASWMPLVLYKSPEWYLSRYPNTNRMENRASPNEYHKNMDDYKNRWIDYDFSLNFFQNYQNLLKKVPVLARMTLNDNINSEFAESILNVKNVYLSYIIINDCENIFYTFYAQDGIRDTYNSVMVWDHSQIVHFWIGVIQSFKIFYSRYIVNSNNIWFSTNLIGCSECIFCDWLENASYCIENISYPKEEYFQKKEEILKEKDKFELYFSSLNKTAKNLASKNVEGEFCVYSENVKDGYFTYRLQNGKNVFFVGDKEWRKNVVDTFCSDDPGFGDIYGWVNLGWANNVYFVDCVAWQNLYYCFLCIDCSYCIGCTGLQNQSYRILNKQYSKAEWEKLAEKIFAQMESEGTLWQFFPPEMNPFYFNDTLAYLIQDFSKQEVIEKWFLWRDEKVRVDIPTWVEIIPHLQIQNFQWFDAHWEWKIDSQITQKVIQDENGDYYRVLKEEKEFLEKYWLPIPTKHWLVRIQDNLRFSR